MAKQPIKVLTKKATKSTAEEKPRSTVKEYSFFQDVYEVVRQIPKGKVTSYGAIATYLGTKLSARMVGWAMNAAHTAKPKVPVQRHFSTPTLMEELLKKDGVLVKNDTVVDFKKRFWDPLTALSL
jgi:methylated-DNA-protein-cysteine methyltransferase related protein